jgi:hypothetical protein
VPRGVARAKAAMAIDRESKRSFRF